MQAIRTQTAACGHVLCAFIVLEVFPLSISRKQMAIAGGVVAMMIGGVAAGIWWVTPRDVANTSISKSPADSATKDGSQADASAASNADASAAQEPGNEQPSDDQVANLASDQQTIDGLPSPQVEFKGLPPDPISPLRKLLERGDGYLVEGNTAAAIKEYNKLLSQTGRLLNENLEMRFALCSEGVGRTQDALARYRKVAGESSSEHFRSCARVAQARIWSATDKPQNAYPLLCGLLIQTGVEPDTAMNRIRSDASHLLGYVMSHEAAVGLSQDPLDDSAVIRSPLSWSAVEILRMLELATAASPPTTSPQPGLEILGTFGSAADGVQIAIVQPRATIQALLDEIAGKSNLSMQWSAPASEMVAGRSTIVVQSATTLSSLLDLLLTPLGCHWRQKDRTIHVFLPKELKPEHERIAQQDRASRSLRTAIANFPDHYLAASSYLALGNLELERRDAQVAVSLYRQLIGRFPNSTGCAIAWFNQGKANMQLAQLDTARDDFYQVTDGFAGHALEAAAYLYIGRLLIESGLTKDAIRPLMRATTLASSVDTQSAGAIALSSAYIMSGNSYAGNMLLMDYRDQLMLPNVRDQVAFARYKSATTEIQRTREGRNLVAALSHVDHRQFFGDYSALMIGEASREMELDDRVITTYESAIKDSPTPIVRDRLVYELADWLVNTGQLEAASQHYQQLSQSGTAKWKRQGELQFAQLAFRQKKDEDCLKSCKGLLESATDDQERVLVLDLMGRIYERRGDYKNASHCFSGLMPNEERTTTGSSANGPS